MTEHLTNAPRRGTVAAIPSKSEAHRLLLCAALGRGPVRFACPGTSRDIEATAACLRALGAGVSWDGAAFTVTPAAVPAGAVSLPCGESGSTLRFLLPVAGALGAEGRFLREGRLPDRPLGPLAEQLCAHGMTLRDDGPDLCFSGRLRGGDFALPGNVSSQYLTGLLFALPLLPEGGTLRVTTALESTGYLDLTLRTLRRCGLRIEDIPGGWRIPGGQRPALPAGCAVGGDWSNAAPFLCAGAISGGVTVTGLDLRSAQGDRAVLDVLRRFGAKVEASDEAVTVTPGPLRGCRIDGREIPDLIPVLCAVAAAAAGDTVIEHAGRLRLKESDRLAAVARLLRDLGGSVDERPDGLDVHGTGALRGGTVDTAGDHRMAMTAAVCSLLCPAGVTVPGAECTEKSYPGFFRDWAALGPDAKGAKP